MSSKGSQSFSTILPYGRGRRFRFWIIFPLLAVQLIWGSFSSALALDQGGGQAGLAYYALRFRTLGQQFSLSEGLGYIEAYQRITNYGVVEGRAAISRLEEPGGTGDVSGWRQAYARLSLKDYRWGRSVLETSAGDQSFLITNLPVRFSNYF